MVPSGRLLIEVLPGSKSRWKQQTFDFITTCWNWLRLTYLFGGTTWQFWSDALPFELSIVDFYIFPSSDNLNRCHWVRAWESQLCFSCRIYNTLFYRKCEIVSMLSIEHHRTQYRQLNVNLNNSDNCTGIYTNSVITMHGFPHGKENWNWVQNKRGKDDSQKIFSWSLRIIIA